MHKEVTILGGVALAALAGSSASAQVANGAEEVTHYKMIIVTAQKLAEDVQDVTVSIVSLSPTILETAGDTVRTSRWYTILGDGYGTKTGVTPLNLGGLLIARDSARETRDHSHSIVPGGLDVTS